MAPDLVVVSTPSLQLFGRIRKRQEPVGVQTLGPEAADEGLDEGIVGRLAGLAEVQGDAMGIGPQVQVSGYELGPLIDTDRLRIAQPTASPVQGLDHVFRAVGEPWINHRREAAKVSTTVRIRILLPVANWSWTKSMAQVSFGRVASQRSYRSLAFNRRLGVLLRS